MITATVQVDTVIEDAEFKYLLEWLAEDLRESGNSGVIRVGASKLTFSPDDLEPNNLAWD